MSENSDNDFEEIEEEHAKAYCYACGDELGRLDSLLICTACLNDECEEFLKEASKE